ncbi:hypothetical protein ACPOL_2466 [Acidisarcina polymorpha]|uniref:DUF4432 domain-containing protein n=1 Tax=Acidisarcina polymorpha TaxID=2211140 RepID=A0A2Z5FY42_9BACT|nr:hypothetical protein [Acidisarcina polymorpha]AXC11788.1 hypothetical protein ACPOL_2466 [Acidisarcina polymorpha]
MTERLILSNESLSVEVLPEFGAKVSSMRLLPEGEELLQQPLRPYAPRTRTMAFEEGDASGIDECIPTVSACDVEFGGNCLPVPDHGDFWRIPFASRREAEELVLEATGFTLPLRFEKRFALEGTRLRIDYRLENVGRQSLPFLWSAHPGFAVEPGDRILLPDSVKEINVWHSGGGRLGAPGQVHSWPHTHDAADQSVDLSLAGGPEDGVGDKLFAVAPREGWVALERRRLRKRIEVRFDPAWASFLGLWLAFGGWPAGQAQRQHCVALEPCTAPADSLATALERGLARILEVEAWFEWKIEIHVIPA